jgi:hypothetical protein
MDIKTSARDILKQKLDRIKKRTKESNLKKGEQNGTSETKT